MPNPDTRPRFLRRTVARLAAALALPLALPAFQSGAAAQAQIVVDVDVLPKATTTGPLSILRVDLTFDNLLPRATVPINGRLRARADVRYTGNGALTGRWLVDGRPLQTFNRTLTFGSSVVLETADIPPLPTFEPGYHDVTLQFSAPAVAFRAPVIRYFVEAAPGAARIVLLQPLDGAVLTRPRRDGLFPSAQQPLQFAWRLTAGLPFKGTRYRFSLFELGSEATPAASALVSTWAYTMPTALAAALATGREYRWQVEVLNESGQVTATSEARRLTPQAPSAIELATPAEDSAVLLPQQLAWSSSRRFDGYAVRVYLNQTLLRQDLEQNVGVARSAGPGGTLGQATWAALFAQTTEDTRETLSRLGSEPQTSGLLLHWIVLGLDAGGNPAGPGAAVVEASEIGTFHLTPTLESLNGLPKALLMAGFEIAVTSYETGATLASLSGRGTVRFVKDRSQTPIPVSFSNLRAEAFREQSRTVTGSGATERVVVSETLKARVLEGRVSETYSPAVTLDLQGYGAELGALALAESTTGGSATADLTLVLPGYADSAPRSLRLELPTGELATGGGKGGAPAMAAPGPGPLRLPLRGIALEPGGDFYQEISGFLASGIRSTRPTDAGLTLLGGSLVADFSTARDFVDGNGGPVPREAGVFLMGGSAALAASSLFPVTAPASVRLSFQSLELKPTGLEGSFDVMGSDAITPVVPAEYHLSFTGGSVALATGLLQATTLTLDGNVELPASVRGASGMRPSARFARLRPSGSFLESQSVTVPVLEWGPAGGTPFRMVDAGGGLLLPWGVISDPQRMGLRIWQKGTLDSPVRLLPDDIGQSTIQSTGPGTATTAAGTTGGTGSTAIRPNTQQGSAAPAATIELNVRAGGVSGVYRSTRPHEGKLGDFHGIFRYVFLGFTDSAVNQSSLEGELVVPAPADFKLSFTEATATSTGEIVGPKIAVPAEIALAYWRSKLVLPPVVGAAPRVGDGTLLAMAGAAGGIGEQTATDAGGLLLAARTDQITTGTNAGGGGGTATPPAGRTTGGLTLVPGVTGGSAENDNPPGGTSTGTGTAPPPAAVGITLSRSYLRISGASLRFVVDPQYGPPEFGDLRLSTLDVGADGRIQASTLHQLGTTFLGMYVLADRASALVFSEWSGGTPAPGAPLVSLDGTITFPTLGDRHVTLAHTASGARADSLTPNGGVVNRTFLKFEAAELAYHNFYAEGKGPYKQFFGKSQVIVLDALHLAGIMEIGLDNQGVYERVGLGIAVDPLRAAALYASGAVTVAAKLGVGGLSLATGQHSSAESEVAGLVGSVAELASAPAGARVDKLLKTVADALRLAKRVRVDLGGSNDDSVGTALNVAGIALDLANGFTKNADRSEKRVALAVADAVDLSLGVIVNAKPGGQPLPREARIGLNLGRLAVKGTRAAIQDGQITRAQWFDLTGQLLEAATDFSADRGYQLAINLLKGIVDVGRSTKPDDPATPLRVASRAFKVIQDSGLVPSSEAQDILVLCQALLEGVLAAKDMPMPQKAVAVASQVLDTASGPGTAFGGGPTAVEVKRQLKLAKRSLDLVGKMATGIPYDQAGKSVQATLHEAGASTEPAYVTVDTLVGSWVLIDGRPLDDTVAELQNLLACPGAASSCAGQSVAALVASAVDAATRAQTPLDLLAALGRLLAVREAADAGGTQGDFATAFDATRSQAVVTKAQAVQDALLAQADAASFLQDVSAAFGRYLEIERTLTQLALQGRGLAALAPHFESKASELARRYADEADRAQDPWAAQVWLVRLLAIERQAELLGMSLTGVDLQGVMNRALGRFWDRAKRAVDAAATSEALRTALGELLSVERQMQLLGVEDPTRDASLAATLSSATARYDAMLRAELTQALQLGSAGIEPAFQSAKQKLSVASRVEDADDAVALYRLFSLSATPVGYTPAQRDASRAELAALFTQKGSALQSEALGRMKSANRGALIDLANRYFLVIDITGQGRNEFNAMVDGWIAQASTKSCEGWADLQDRLESPIFRYTEGKTPALRTAVRELAGRCAGEGPGPGGPDPAQLYTDGAKSELDALSKFLKDIPARRRAGQPDTYLKEELAWHLAERVKGLTGFFKNGRDATQRVLGRVYDQTDFVLRYRRAGTAERVIAAIQLISDPLLTQEGIDPAIRAEIKRVSDGLIQFAKLGGPAKEGVDLGIDLVFGMALGHLPDGLAKAGVMMTYLGLQEARRPAAENKNSDTPIVFAAAAGAMLWQEISAKLFPGPPPAIVKPVTELARMFGDLTEGTGSGVSPVARLEAAMSFLEKASDLPVVGRYLMPLQNPARHLVAPDADQQDYVTNLLLAELAAARNDNPANARIYFKSTCPTISFDTGVRLPTGATAANDLFVCAIDLAREAIGSHMKGAVDPSSPAGQGQLSQQTIGAMRQNAVFTRASGNDQLSGISGALLHRNGRFSEFDLLGTFGLVGLFETAAQIRLDEPNRKLTIQQVSYGPQDRAGLLSQLGLGDLGVNRLFGDRGNYLSSPIKDLFIEIGGPNACLNARARIVVNTPLGAWNAARPSLGLCFDPFSFDIGVTTRAVYFPIGIENRYHLFFAGGNGGFDLGVTAGVYPQILGVGVYIEADAGLGLGAGLGGIEACGRFEAGAGYTVPSSSGGADCGGRFVPDDPNYRTGPGVCRQGGTLGAQLRLGTSYRNFYVKAQGGVQVGLIYVGGWLYLSGAAVAGGTFEQFPSNRYGGWSGATSINCGPP